MFSLATTHPLRTAAAPAAAPAPPSPPAPSPPPPVAALAGGFQLLGRVIVGLSAAAAAAAVVATVTAVAAANAVATTLRQVLEFSRSWRRYASLDSSGDFVDASPAAGYGGAVAHGGRRLLASAEHLGDLEPLVGERLSSWPQSSRGGGCGRWLSDRHEWLHETEPNVPAATVPNVILSAAAAAATTTATATATATKHL